MVIVFTCRQKEWNPILTFDNSVAKLEQRRAVEGKSAAHQNVENDAKRPEI
jgi:hypothetical protein